MYSEKDDETLVHIFSQLIERYGTSVRLGNCLFSEKIFYVGDLIQKTEKELLKIRSFGRLCLIEVKDFLKKFDLELGIKIPNWQNLSDQELIKEFHKQQTLLRISFPSPSPPDNNTLIKLLRNTDELDLSIRATNCLRKLKLQYIGDLVLKKRSELMKIRNLGRTSVTEIENKLNNMGLQLGMRITGWPPENINEMLKRFAKDLESEKKLEKEALHRDLGIITLEDELNYLAKLAGQERNIYIIIKHFGWDGKGAKTLEFVGQEYDMTRERVRQICETFENKITKLKLTKSLYLPLLDKALNVILNNLPSSAEDIEIKFVNQSITRNNFHLDGIITAAKLFGRKIPFRIVILNKKRFVLQAEASKTPKIIINLAKKIIAHWGVATISDITARTEELSKQNITNDFTISVLSLFFKDFSWLDKSGGWFWIRTVPRNRLINLIKKIMAVTEQIDISDLRAGISRFSRMEGFAPPRRVLLELCQQIPWVRVDRNMVEADPTLNWEEILTTNEWAMTSVLKEYGPLLQRDYFEEKCLELGMNPVTFNIYLANSPIIAGFTKDIYGLRGGKIPPGLLSALKPQQKPKILKDFGWTSDGKIWLANRLSRGMIRSGFFYIPGGMKQFLQGDFTMIAADGIFIEHLKIKDSNGWSLNRFFQRRGGEPGDFLVLIFDLFTRKVEARIGAEDLLDEFQSVKL
jgi:hypothetical protein